ncbi:MAG: hypothetical protein ACRENJ_02115 [Candidatus Eiseniibacteriota bacterium]
MTVRAHWGAAALTVVVLGCASPLDPTTSPRLTLRDDGAEMNERPDFGQPAPGPALKPMFYPLAVGNRWVYEREAVVRFVTPEGETPPSIFRTTAWQVIKCAQHDYFFELAVVQTPVADVSWRRYREAPTGLYEMGVALTEVPCVLLPAGATRSAGSGRAALAEPAAPGSPAVQAAFRGAMRRMRERIDAIDAMVRPGPQAALGLPPGGSARPGELWRLRYPLEVKAGWTIVENSGFRLAAQVEGTETLDLPAGRLTGYRIRLHNSALGPTDVVRVWYGPAGFLQLVAHIELPAVDEGGNFIGLAIADLRETLVELQLGRKPKAGVAPRD